MFSRREKWLLVAMATIQFNYIVDFMIMMPLGPQLMRVFNVGATEFGNLISAYTFAAGVAGFVGSFFLDRFDRKHVLTFLSFFFGIGNLLCAWSTSYPGLLAARAATGASGGLLIALLLAILGDSFPLERRGRATGYVMLAVSLGTVLGVPLGIFLAAGSNWHLPFYFLGLNMCFLAVVAAIYFPSMSGHRAHARTESRLVMMRDILSKERTVLPLVIYFLVAFGAFLIIPYISPTLVANVGLSERELSIVYLAGGLTTLLSNPWIGKLVDRFGARRAMVVALPAAIPAFLLVTHLGPMPKVWVVATAVFIFLCSSARNVPTTTYITTLVPPERRGAFMGLASTVQQLAVATSTSLAGYIIVRAPDGRFLRYGQVGILASVVSLLTMWLVMRAPKPLD